jgi:predicted nucleic acid-binding Zn ribbon protein
VQNRLNNNNYDGKAINRWRQEMKTTVSDGCDKGISKIDQQSLFDLQDGVVQAAMVVMTLVAALIGVWGVLSLCSGIALGGGVVEMGRNWLAAVGF